MVCRMLISTLYQAPVPRWLGVMLLAASVGCHAEQNGQPDQDATADSGRVAVVDIDAALGESLYPGEALLAADIATVIEKSIRFQYNPGSARRDAHPKAHGCVKAEIAINEHLPEPLAQGIFVPGKTWQAWIRFSNGSSDADRADIKRDARGMAIKVLDVPGKKLLAEEADATSQDFILINHPVFFGKDPERYLSLVKDASSESFFRKLHIPFSLGVRGTWIAWRSSGHEVANPLEVRYWSMVPYQLGAGAERRAVKYSVRSCSSVATPMPREPGNDYLRDAMRATLQKGDACMELLVQPRTSPKMSVEDSMTEWKEKEAPFHAVATIRIPQQVFDTPEQHAFCENLSFNPWHALPEHRPLGVTNRLRKIIYEHVSRVRHDMNSATTQDPE